MDLHSKSKKSNKRSPAFSSFKEKECRASLFINIISILIVNCHTIHQKSFLERNKFSSSSFTHGAYWSHTRPSYHRAVRHVHALRRTVAAMQTNAQTHRVRGLRRQLFHRLIYITLARLQFLFHHKASHRHAGAFIKPHRRFIK